MSSYNAALTPAQATIDRAPSTYPGAADTGWTAAAFAVRSVLQIPTPLLLRLHPEGFEPLYIDFRHHAFDWSQPFADFPANPTHVDIETEPAPAGSPPLFDLPAQNLDNLLWAIGISSFDGEVASWLRPGDRYKLTRWPNFTEVPHSVDHLRLTAILGSAYLTQEELARIGRVDLRTARSLINALSLMNVLAATSTAPDQSAVAPVSTSVATPPSQAPSVSEASATPPGLFSRLRHRLGL